MVIGKVIIIIEEAGVVETISFITHPIVSRIATVIAGILVVWMVVHEPTSLETIHRIHPKRTTIEVTGEPPVGAIVVVITSGVSPGHGVPPAKGLRPSA